LTIGVGLTLVNKVVFHPIGFLTSLISCIIFVIQNIFSKQLFNTTNGVGNDVINPSKLDKLNLLFYSNLTAFFCSVPIWLRQDISSPEYHFPNLYISGIFVLNGMSHFMQNWLAFHLLSLVSPVTYSIASLIKRIYVIIASIIWFGDKVTPLQSVGIGLTFVGLYLYQDAKQEVDLREGLVEEKEVLPSHNHSSLHVHAK
jgi:solute carrier family 35 protein E1